MSTEKPIGCRACGNPIYNNQSYPNTVPKPNDSYLSKVLENTVRVPSSEYTMNKSALNVYIPPIINPTKSLYGVNWNQMSDRAVPGVVKTNVPSYGNSTRSSVTRMRPGSTSAPGKGVDMKHGSYDRYLARLKGKSVLRTQPEKIINNVTILKSGHWGIAYSYSCTTLNGCPIVAPLP
jgi:hypothetical protein